MSNLTSAVNPSHYKRGGIELIDITETLPTCRGNAVKYLVRQGEKGDEDDWLKDATKAFWYAARNLFYEFGSHALEVAISELSFIDQENSPPNTLVTTA